MRTKLLTEFEIQYLSPIHHGYPAWPGGERWLCLYETDGNMQIVTTRGLSDKINHVYEVYLETNDKINMDEFDYSWQGNLVYETGKIIPNVKNLDERLKRNTYLCLQINMADAPLEWSLDHENGNIGLFIGLQRNETLDFISNKSIGLNIKLMRPQELLYSIQNDMDGRIKLAQLYDRQGGATLSSLVRKSVV